MDTKDFLELVITSGEGYLCVATCDNNGTNWKETWFQWPDQITAVAEFVRHNAKLKDVHYAPHLFNKKRSAKENVLPTRTVVVDLDEADIGSIPIHPTVLVGTSPERHQGYWIMRDAVDVEGYENISKRLTANIPRADMGAWMAGHRFRVPGTINYKYPDKPQVHVIHTKTNGRVYANTQFDVLPYVNGRAVDLDLSWIKDVQAPDGAGPQEIMQKLRGVIPARVYTQYNKEAKDRSKALWALTTTLFGIGLPREQVFYLAKHSANNKFARLKYDADEELAKDVLRAENTSSEDAEDIRARITALRKVSGNLSEKREYISQLIRERLEKEGTFVNAIDGLAWYVHDSTGMPLVLAPASQKLESFLDLKFGMNASEGDTRYVIRNLMAHTDNLPQTGRVATLSFFDERTNTLLVHNGRDKVYRITKDKIDTVPNGYDNVIFPWYPNNEAFYYDASVGGESWEHLLLGDVLSNATYMSSTEARMLIRTWFLFILFRDASVARPILALFGQPGSGKSTTCRLLYTLIYGKYKHLHSVTSAEDFDRATASNPVVVLDNVDTYQAWLIDRLALAAAKSDINKRKLWTDTDLVTITRQAVVGITAHAPKFTREDVVDRMILVTLERLDQFIPETLLVERVSDNRSKIWSLVMKDIQKILALRMPTQERYAKFRVNDFVRLGSWFARALDDTGEQETLFVQAITKAVQQQKEQNLETDDILISALRRYATRDAAKEFKPAGHLWSALETLSVDEIVFRKTYRNPVTLGRKLWALKDAIEGIMNVEWEYDTRIGARTWKFSLKEESNE
jgi:hypothetical protein